MQLSQLTIRVGLVSANAHACPHKPALVQCKTEAIMHQMDVVLVTTLEAGTLVLVLVLVVAVGWEDEVDAAVT